MLPPILDFAPASNYFISIPPRSHSQVLVHVTQATATDQYSSLCFTNISQAFWIHESNLVILVYMYPQYYSGVIYYRLSYWVDFLPIRGNHSRDRAFVIFGGVDSRPDIKLNRKDMLRTLRLHCKGQARQQIDTSFNRQEGFQSRHIYPNFLLVIAFISLIRPGLTIS